MKNLKNVFAILMILLLTTANAQTSKNNTAPPTVDPLTNCTLRYYYFPNLEAYFDTKTKIYIYSIKGEWLTASELPNGYRGYSLSNKISVFITDYDEDDVTQFIKIHKKKFPYMHKGRSTAVTASVD